VEVTGETIEAQLQLGRRRTAGSVEPLEFGLQFIRQTHQTAIDNVDLAEMAQYRTG
jgi:hypothetical protein